MMAKKLENMTLDELVSRQQELMAQSRAIKEQKQAVQEYIDLRTAEEEARRKLESMNDAEKLALAQMITAEGIQTAETVGTPGQ